MKHAPLRHKSSLIAAVALLAGVVVIVPAAQAVTIPTVPVGDTGNAGEVQSQGTFGAVAYDYRIGTTEVTNAQYAEFLTAKAASDALELYDANMGSDARGGITQSGVSGSFTYTTKTNMGNKPVNYVNWYDSIRFANWLNNGQGIGDTETGAYTLLGGTATPSNGLSITRNVGATWFLPSEDEWYKAAYYQPAAEGGDADDYWLYPTANNTAPTVATADSVGNISNSGANVANYMAGADWNSLNGNVTTVGSAGPLSDSFYGTADQGGNVWEWNEALISGSFRAKRGGSYSGDAGLLEPTFRSFSNPLGVDRNVGFRVATVPEPSTLALAAFGFAAVAAYGWRRRTGVTHRSPSTNIVPRIPLMPRITASLLVLATFAVAPLASSAAIISQSGIGPGVVSISQFDPALGTLNSVAAHLEAFAEVGGQVGYFPPPPEPGMLQEVGFTEVFAGGGFLDAVSPDLSVFVDLSSAQIGVALAPDSFLPVFVAANGMSDKTATDVSSFVGTGIVDFVLEGVPGVFGFLLGPFIDGWPTGSIVGGTLTVTYDYMPVPEPSTVALAALGFAALALFGWRRCKG